MQARKTCGVAADIEAFATFEADVAGKVALCTVIMRIVAASASTCRTLHSS